MSAATITPSSGRPPSGATAVEGAHHHPLGNALRAVKVFLEAAFGVVVLGEYGEETGVHRK
ncbi:hypothetical protein JK359_07715 [Streptomyces actinomycinicus]|uniref:Uncharacterized protein n=1 Tax=Streptomyces actinomycinicus TaxID=1695166 RepID=A0A937EGY7_9ACTN|nr:hypothetical protein [Streptomyces actinomycinicus]MBL1081869.1 hypothetical protein [Streptomyces actinomycinicus]